MRTLFVSVMLMTGCENLTTQVSATEEALCEVWQQSLPTRSRLDTEATKASVQVAIATHAIHCLDGR